MPDIPSTMEAETVGFEESVDVSLGAAAGLDRIKGPLLCQTSVTYATDVTLHRYATVTIRCLLAT